MDNTFDKMFYGEGDLIAGIDESGVSDIAGPLVAACVILPKIEDLKEHDLRIFEIDDCKKIPEKYRSEHTLVIQGVATAIGIGEVAPSDIDILGKHGSVRLAMVRAIMACCGMDHRKVLPDFILYDYADFHGIPVDIKQKGIKGGDQKSLCIAAASIVAKVWRDNQMTKLHTRFPHYGWINNKGYPCENQFRGLDEFGIAGGIHRLRRWPFIANNRQPEEKTIWNKRRKLWRQKTEQNMIQSAIGDAGKSKKR